MQAGGRSPGSEHASTVRTGMRVCSNGAKHILLFSRTGAKTRNRNRQKSDLTRRAQSPRRGLVQSSSASFAHFALKIRVFFRHRLACGRSLATKSHKSAKSFLCALGCLLFRCFVFHPCSPLTAHLPLGTQLTDFRSLLLTLSASGDLVAAQVAIVIFVQLLEEL